MQKNWAEKFRVEFRVMKGNGYSMRKVTNYLKLRGITTSTGNAWYTTQLKLNEPSNI